MTVFFTADTHFGHAGALALYRRPFTSVATMNEAMVTSWNATVGPEDDIWHLGDFALRMKQPEIAALLNRLHGSKHLIVGNNDPPDVTALPGCRVGQASHPVPKSRWMGQNWFCATMPSAPGTAWRGVPSICSATATAP
jgi:hypothetical protein